jgi:hypothetical protein
VRVAHIEVISKKNLYLTKLPDSHYNGTPVTYALSSVVIAYITRDEMIKNLEYPRKTIVRPFTTKKRKDRL